MRRTLFLLLLSRLLSVRSTQRLVDLPTFLCILLFVKVEVMSASQFDIRNILFIQFLLIRLRNLTTYTHLLNTVLSISRDFSFGNSISSNYLCRYWTCLMEFKDLVYLVFIFYLLKLSTVVFILRLLDVNLQSLLNS